MVQKINRNRNRWLIGLALALLLVLVCSVALADVVFNSSNFPDANFRYVLTHFYGWSYGETITDDVLNKITRIQCAGCGASTLQGIEYFPSLQVIECSLNNLTSLDVSHCKALQSINCDENQLTSLNVSNCTALELLNCEKNNLTSLDVSGCVAMTQFYCNDNQLTSLNLSNCTSLVELKCHNNQLTMLDVSDCGNLYDLVCYQNQLTSLDVSKNTFLNNLNCYSNRLTALDVSKNTKLYMLYCYDNQLTKLDVSKCEILNEVFCKFKPLDKGTSYQWFDVMADYKMLWADKNVEIISTENAEEEPTAIAVTKVTLNKTKSTLTRTGKQTKPTLQLKATAEPAEATDKTVTWISSNKKVATVDNAGKVTALKAGTAKITCVANDGSGVSAVCTVTVKDAKVTKITLNKTKATLKVKGKLQLSVKKFSPTSPLNNKVKWTTSDKKVATVDKNGKVKAKKTGTCEITCMATDGSKKYATCKITVK